MGKKEVLDMEKRFYKADLVKRVVDKLKDTKIVIGGNKYFYKKLYHLKYTQIIVSNVINAFLDELVSIAGNGDSVELRGYFVIEPVYCKETVARNCYTNEPLIIPPRYRIKIHSGSHFEEVSKRLTEKELNEKTGEQCHEE